MNRLFIDNFSLFYARAYFFKSSTKSLVSLRKFIYFHIVPEQNTIENRTIVIGTFSTSTFPLSYPIPIPRMFCEPR